MKKARVIEERKTNYVITADDGEYVATVRGSFFTEGHLPKVGDFVHCSIVSEDQAVIEEILPRTSTIARKAVGTGGAQVIVANVDLIFVVMGLDGDFNLSRLERYLLLARQSNVSAVVLLNKRDVVDDPERYVQEVRAAVAEVPVYAVSATTGEHMEVLLIHLEAGKTAVLLGSSGAGKSTITNWLLYAAAQQVQAVRTDDSRGRHTTTARQLFTLPSGGYLIDTPGMRELGVESTEADEGAVFAQLEALSYQCKFSNCDHEKSTGCALIAAVATGDITERQLSNYLKLQRERFFEETKHDGDASREYKRKQKDLSKNIKRLYK